MKSSKKTGIGKDKEKELPEKTEADQPLPDDERERIIRRLREDLPLFF